MRWGEEERFHLERILKLRKIKITRGINPEIGEVLFCYKYFVLTFDNLICAFAMNHQVLEEIQIGLILV